MFREVKLKVLSGCFDVFSPLEELQNHLHAHFILFETDRIPSWWIWGFWISPLMYAQDAASVNEFLGHSWDKVQFHIVKFFYFLHNLEIPFTYFQLFLLLSN